MKSKLPAILSVCLGGVFVLSEILYSDLLILNLGLSLAAFLFLPKLIKEVFNIKFHFSLIYLAYLGAYITAVFLARTFSLDLFVLSTIIRLLVGIGFYGLLSLNFYVREYKIDWRYIALLVVALIGILFLNFGVLRQPGSIISLDSLQHQSVVNQSYSDLKICISPSQCNNLFLKDGYTTTYHSVLFFVSPSDFLTQSRIAAMDIVWLVISAIAVFMFVKHFIKDQRMQVIVTAVSLLVFVNGAYEFILFIPQTFSFFIFMMSFTRKKLSNLELVTFAISMLLVHLIMGAFLTFLMVMFELIKRKTVGLKSITLVATLGMILTFLFSALQLTFEKIFQSSEIEFLGNATNKAFPENLTELANINLILVIGLLATTLVYLLGFRKEKASFTLLPLALTSVAVYFFSPTYANKFLIGIGLYGAIVVIEIISDLIKNATTELIVITLCIAFSALAFVGNYKLTLSFYKTGDNVYSALNGKEKSLINFLKNTQLDCEVVTDPFSQIAITGLTKFQTYQGQYMSPDYRKIIHNFLQKPNEATLGAVLAYLDQENTCFIYSYRLEEARVEKIDMWANQLYYYVVDSSKTLNDDLEPIKVLDKDMNLVYRDKYYYVFK